MISEEFTSYSFVQKNLVVGAFVYYFVGLVISRIGSLFIEPILRKSSFLKFADYAEFVSASQKDSKLEVLSEVNNMYRTLSSMLVLLLLLRLYEFIELEFPILKGLSPYILIAVLLVVFLYSYMKQTEYVTERIKANR